MYYHSRDKRGFVLKHRKRISAFCLDTLCFRLFSKPWLALDKWRCQFACKMARLQWIGALDGTEVEVLQLVQDNSCLGRCHFELYGYFIQTPACTTLVSREKSWSTSQ
jgi:hypothetical protein